MTHGEIREKFLNFFKNRGHTIVPSSSLLPDDPSVLFTTAGMQQFKKYYTGELDAKNDFKLENGQPAIGTMSVQKSMRTSDIDEVGDESHLTFFEMLGNFSFGGYWKEDAIKWAHEFITKEMSLEISYVSVFKGSDIVPKDEESKEIWKSLGVKNVREEGMDDVFWGPTGNSGPCGPTTEIYCKDSAGRDVEIWNIVFNEFFCNGSREQLLKGEATLTPLKTRGIDTGMGLERLAMVSQNKNNIFETDLFESILILLPSNMELRVKRIMADHARSMAFLISDGVRPSNKERGYVLRKIMRRAMVHEAQNPIRELENNEDWRAISGEIIKKISNKIVDIYKPSYKELDSQIILEVFNEEHAKFSKTLHVGLKELGKTQKIDASIAFKLYESFGLPFEIIKDIAPERTKLLTREAFDEEFKKHQEKSRAGQEKKFGGHGLILDTGELKAGNEEELAKVLRLHTATHLLHASLRKILGEEVRQAGSDITAERLRFDFNFSRKMTPEEIKKVEELINDAIKKDMPVSMKEMPYEEAVKLGALSFFKEKYPSVVKVYTVGDWDKPFSRELCGGPHVENTGKIGGIKIKKEESVGAGVRRIRAALSEQ